MALDGAPSCNAVTQALYRGKSIYIGFQAYLFSRALARKKEEKLLEYKSQQVKRFNFPAFFVERVVGLRKKSLLLDTKTILDRYTLV
jgi:hypothetical protein